MSFFKVLNTLPSGFTSDIGNPSQASATTDMTGFYILTVFNLEGCNEKDSTYVDVLSNSCCLGMGPGYVSRDNYTGDWSDVNSWASTLTPIPPPTNPMSSQPICINGYITLNSDLTLNGGTQRVCDTLVITGNLLAQNPSLTVTSTGVLIVLGDLAMTTGSITNEGRVIFVGDFEVPYDLGGSGEYYVFDPTPTVPVWFTTPTYDESELETMDPDLYDFYSGLACGGGFSGGTIAAGQSICAGDDVAAFTNTASAGPGTGFTYQWYLSTDSSDPATGTWTPIGGATGLTHDHGTITQTTHFYRHATNGTCMANSNTLTVTVLVSPTVDDIADPIICQSYTLPAITGSNLTGNESYFTGSGGTGTQYFAGNAITSTMTLYIYDANGSCSSQETVLITIQPVPVTGPVNHINDLYLN